MNVVNQGDARQGRGQSGHHRGSHRMGMNQLKPAAADEMGQLPRWPQIEAVAHRCIDQGRRLALPHDGEAARLHTCLRHLEPQRFQPSGEQVLDAFRAGVMLAVDDM